MSEERDEEIAVDLNEWFAVCDAGDEAQAIFPTENLAVWYLEKYGWTNWRVRQISAGRDGKLFLSEKQYCQAVDDES